MEFDRTIGGELGVKRVRPAWDEYFMSIATLAACRSTCLRRQVGAVLVRDWHILATGYNGAPAGLAHCLEVGCLRDELKIPSGERHEMCIGVHAEQNLLIQAALYGGSPEGATIYCTHQPCTLCAKLMVNARIIRVVFKGEYPDSLSVSILSRAGVKLERYPTSSYPTSGAK
jgi:dCMP deaminase